MKISSVKNLFLILLLAVSVAVLLPRSSMAEEEGSGGTGVTYGEDGTVDLTDDFGITSTGNDYGAGDAATDAAKNALDNYQKMWGNIFKGEFGEAFRNAVNIFDIGTYLEGIGGTEMQYTDPFTGETKTYIVTIWGTDISTEGVTKGCAPLPVKWAKDQKCIFCPLFGVLFAAANTMSQMSFDKLAEPFSIVLLVGFAIWIALKVIAHVSALTKQDAPKFLVGLINESFKVMIAYLLLTNAHAIYSYAISPILGAGLEFGSAVLFNTDSFSACTGSATLDNGKDLLPHALYIKLDCFIKAIQKEISFMQSIGSTLMCIGRHEGKIAGGLIWDFGMVFQGLILYLFAVALSLAFAFYLIDATVQLGLVGALMPFLIACWPFGPTKGYTKKGWEMFLNTFFVYVFLGIVVSINMQLIGQAMTNSGEAAAGIASEQIASACSGQESGLKALACVISNSDIQTLKQMTDLGFGGFLILLCCCIFGFKFTSQSSTLANSMASGGISGIGSKIGGLAASGAGALAKKATQPARNAISRGARKVMDGAGEKVGNAAKMVGSAIGSSSVGRAAKNVAGKGMEAAAKVAGGALGVHGGKDGKGTAGANRRTKNNPLARKMVADMLKKSRELQGKGGSGGSGGGTHSQGGSSGGGSSGGEFSDTNANNSIEQELENSVQANENAQGGESGSQGGGTDNSHNNNGGGSSGNSHSEHKGDHSGGSGRTSGRFYNYSDEASNIDEAWSNYATDKQTDVVRDKDGNYTSYKTRTADGRLRMEYSKDKDGNEHFKNYNKDGELKNERFENADGSAHGWYKSGDKKNVWERNADGSRSETTYYKGNATGGFQTDKDGNTKSWGEHGGWFQANE